MSYVLPSDFGGYEKGTALRDVTLREARSWECNRCGGCCAGDLPDDVVKKDEATGLPLSVWGSNAPDDRYEARYGKPLLQPIVLGDGGPQLGDSWEEDADGKPYRAFRCSMFSYEEEEECGSCALYEGADPTDISTLRPRNCGEFPVFGQAVDDTIIAGNAFVPMTGAFPRCTWYGIRVVGPYRSSDFWKYRWEAQQRGEAVADMTIPSEFFDLIIGDPERKQRIEVVVE